jgi:hypothetical protein
MKTALSLVALAGLAVTASGAGPQADDPKGLEFYEKNILPILQGKCFKCHSKDAKKLKGKLRLDNKEDALKGGDTGPAIVPKDPAKSLAYVSITYKNEDLQMPPEEEDKLTAEQVKKFEEWIKMGAPGLKPKAEVDKK